MTARAASTYRAARRNTWRGSGEPWPQTGAVREPYKAKPDRFIATPAGVFPKTRKQPKKYPYASVRQNTRAKWRHERWLATSPNSPLAVAA